MYNVLQIYNVLQCPTMYFMYTYFRTYFWHIWLNVPIFPAGYNQMLIIPVGATSIRIAETVPTRNYLGTLAPAALNELLLTLAINLIVSSCANQRAVRWSTSMTLLRLSSSHQEPPRGVLPERTLGHRVLPLHARRWYRAVLPARRRGRQHPRDHHRPRAHHRTPGHRGEGPGVHHNHDTMIYDDIRYIYIYDMYISINQTLLL